LDERVREVLKAGNVNMEVEHTLGYDGYGLKFSRGDCWVYDFMKGAVAVDFETAFVELLGKIGRAMGQFGLLEVVNV